MLPSCPVTHTSAIVIWHEGWNSSGRIYMCDSASPGEVRGAVTGMTTMLLIKTKIDNLIACCKPVHCSRYHSYDTRSFKHVQRSRSSCILRNEKSYYSYPTILSLSLSFSREREEQLIQEFISHQIISGGPSPSPCHCHCHCHAFIRQAGRQYT